jgi:hypothetical protein
VNTLFSSKNHRFRIGIAAIAIVGCFSWFVQSQFSVIGVGDPKRAATAFLDDLALGRIEAAYSRTSVGFQSNHSPESLYRLLDLNPDLNASYWRDENVITVKPRYIDTNSPCCQVFIKNDVLRAYLELIADGNRWKVSTIILQTTRPSDAR